MKLAYIILAHNAPKHLARLISNLQHPDDTFFVHIDAKVDLAMFKKEINSENVVFIKKRENGRWGGDGIIKASITGIKLAYKYKADYVIQLSGADYPIQNTQNIRSFFINNYNRSFITYQKLNTTNLNFKGLDRINHYTFNILNKRITQLPFKHTKHYSFKGKFLNALLCFYVFFLPPRSFPLGDANCYYGSTWWAISNKHMKIIIDFISKNSEYIKYFKNSNCGDELFFQSILLNKVEDLTEIKNKSLWYIDFPANASHPNILDESYWEDINNSNKLFARKFNENDKILNLIDNKIK